MLGGRYRLEERVGRGGMSVVYRAYDERLRRPVAVKLLAGDAADDASFHDRFRRETQMVAALNHPGIATVFDTGQEDGQQYLVMEYLPWPTLRQLASIRPLMPAPRAVSLVLQIADALSLAHRHGLVHCDVKPDNVLVGPDDRVKVVDFGIAQAATATGVWNRQELWGTAAYLAPEQVDGHKVDERTDVYALGLVLYELLTGELPFSGRTPSEIALARVTQTPALASGPGGAIAAPLADVIGRCLRRSPEERYQSMGELIAGLTGAAAGLSPPYEIRLPGSGSRAAEVRRPDTDAGPWIPERGPVTGDSTHASGSPTGAIHDVPTIVIGRSPVAADAPPRVRSHRRWLLLASYLVVLLLLAGAVWAFGGKSSGVLSRVLSLPRLEFLRPELDTPDLVGLTPDEAAARIGEQELVLRYGEPRNSEQVMSGRIMEQFPLPRSSIRSGSVITVVTSLGPRMVTVPNLVGRNPNEADPLLGQLELRLGIVKTKQDTAKQGTILEQTPRAGQSIRPGSVVDLVVSSGMPVRVPRVIGMRRSDAEKALHSANLELGSVREVRWIPTPDAVKGIVIAQDPAPGQSVPSGTTVALVVLG